MIYGKDKLYNNITYEMHSLLANTLTNTELKPNLQPFYQALWMKYINYCIHLHRRLRQNRQTCDATILIKMFTPNLSLCFKTVYNNSKKTPFTKNQNKIANLYCNAKAKILVVDKKVPR